MNFFLFPSPEDSQVVDACAAIPVDEIDPG